VEISGKGDIVSRYTQIFENLLPGVSVPFNVPKFSEFSVEWLAFRELNFLNG